MTLHLRSISLQSVDSTLGDGCLKDAVESELWHLWCYTGFGEVRWGSWKHVSSLFTSSLVSKSKAKQMSL